VNNPAEGRQPGHHEERAAHSIASAAARHSRPPTLAHGDEDTALSHNHAAEKQATQAVVHPVIGRRGRPDSLVGGARRGERVSVREPSTRTLNRWVET
jgi:hypothetical protein